MTNVTKLPDRMERQWQVHVRKLREVYQEHGTDQQELEYLLQALKPSYMTYALADLKFVPKDGADAYAQINDWVTRMIDGLLWEVMAREIELYRLRGSGAARP